MYLVDIAGYRIFPVNENVYLVLVRLDAYGIFDRGSDRILGMIEGVRVVCG